MSFGFFEKVKRVILGGPELHPVDRELAKRWIKQRLIVTFPELRNNPRALERAYQSLSLEARDGKGEGEEGTIFEVHCEGEITQ